MSEAYEFTSVTTFGDFQDAVATALAKDHPTVIANEAHNKKSEFTYRLYETEAMVTDFDGTAHKGNHWRDLRPHMTPDHQARHDASLQAYHERVEPNAKEEIRFLRESVEAIYGLSKHKIADAARGLGIRPGLRELMASYNRAAVVSYGFGPVIELWCAEHLNSRPVDVYAVGVDWSYDQAGTPHVGKINEHSCYVNANKGWALELFCAKRMATHGKLLVLGDSPTDVKLLDTRCVSVLVVPRNEPEKARGEFRERGLQRLWDNVSAVLVGDTLEPLVALRRSC